MIEAWLFFAIPNTPALVLTAKQVSRSLDPDAGGYEAFNMVAKDAALAEWRVYGTYCHQSFCDVSVALQADPATLHALVVNDPRWQGQTMPTLAEIQALCAAVVIKTDYGFQKNMADLGLTLVQSWP